MSSSLDVLDGRGSHTRCPKAIRDASSIFLVVRLDVSAVP
jgi:hypothetical protein